MSTKAIFRIVPRVARYDNDGYSSSSVNLMPAGEREPEPSSTSTDATSPSDDSSYSYINTIGTADYTSRISAPGEELDFDATDDFTNSAHVALGLGLGIIAAILIAWCIYMPIAHKRRALHKTTRPRYPDIELALPNLPAAVYRPEAPEDKFDPPPAYATHVLDDRVVCR